MFSIRWIRSIPTRGLYVHNKQWKLVCHGFGAVGNIHAYCVPDSSFIKGIFIKLHFLYRYYILFKLFLSYRFAVGRMRILYSRLASRAGSGSGRTLRNVSGRIRAQNVELPNEPLIFFHFQVASNFVFSNANTNLAKSVGICVGWCIIPLSPFVFFPRASYIWSKQTSSFLKKVDIKINSHTWLKRYLE